MNSRESLPLVALVRELGVRLRTLWQLKLIGLTLGIGAFFVGYFRLLNHPVFPVAIMPITAFDRLIGVHPEALVLYVSLWLYVPLAFALQKHRRDLFERAGAAVVLGGIGLGIFFRWPTAVPDFGRAAAAHPWLSFLKTVDASGNACPSLHVAFAVFAAISLGRVLSEVRAHRFVHFGNWLWCAGIVYSTLATRQHVALDVLAGLALGAAVALPRFSRS